MVASAADVCISDGLFERQIMCGTAHNVKLRFFSCFSQVALPGVADSAGSMPVPYSVSTEVPLPSALITDNRLLALLPATERRRVASTADLVSLELGELLFDVGQITSIYFPTSGVISKVVRMDDGDGIEAGMVGYEGMVPLCLFLDLDNTPFRAIVQNPGTAWRVKPASFKAITKPGSLL
ncbi:MAG: Crp/Fnr family transcriptional regulator, partial [Planctomycetes bacterium]|nr:Crp/Fnr family transcriptional regulator [Planctomycetota bacterium]